MSERPFGHKARRGPFPDPSLGFSVCILTRASERYEQVFTQNGDTFKKSEPLTFPSPFKSQRAA